VVVTVRVEVSAEAPVMLTEVGDRAQVAGLLAAVGLMAQVRATLPVNPPEGVTLIVDVLPVVAPAATEMLPLLLKAKEPVLTAVVTVRVTGVVSVVVPEVPETVTV
jgi:hypothetical protein